MRDVARCAQAADARDLCTSGGLRVLRTSGGLTLADLADLVSLECGFPLAASVVSRWERNLMLPGPRRAPALFAVAEALQALPRGQPRVKSIEPGLIDSGAGKVTTARRAAFGLQFAEHRWQAGIMRTAPAGSDGMG